MNTQGTPEQIEQVLCILTDLLKYIPSSWGLSSSEIGLFNYGVKNVYRIRNHINSQELRHQQDQDIIDNLMRSLDEAHLRISQLEAKLALQSESLGSAGYELPSEAVMYSPTMELWIPRHCPHCASEHYRIERRPIYRMVVTQTNDDRVFTCNECGWQWEISDSGQVKNLNDGIPF